MSSPPTIQPSWSLKSVLFWFTMGKSSWVPSRTQGSIPMLFCRWADLLWVLHSLLVPSNGWWLDQGQWSLYLFFCYCGNDETMALYQTKSVFVISKLRCFRYSWTWFVIVKFELRCNFWMLRTGCICGWRSLNLLRSWLCVWNVVWNPSRFHGLPRLYGLKLDGLTVQIVTIMRNLL